MANRVNKLCCAYKSLLECYVRSITKPRTTYVPFNQLDVDQNHDTCITSQFHPPIPFVFTAYCQWLDLRVHQRLLFSITQTHLMKHHSLHHGTRRKEILRDCPTCTPYRNRTDKIRCLETAYAVHTWRLSVQQHCTVSCKTLCGPEHNAIEQHHARNRIRIRFTLRSIL